MPCLMWWCAEPASWPGMKLGSASAVSTKYRIASASRIRPMIAAGTMRAGRLVIAVLGGEEVHGAERAGHRAVDGERRQAIGLEEPHEEADGEEGGDGGGQRAHERRTAHAV